MDDISEFHRKYVNTYFRYRDQVVSLTGIDIDNENIHLNGKEAGLLILKYPKCFKELNFEIPSSGFFNYNGYGIYLFKNPARQWRRGLCSENHELYNPFKCLLNTGVYRPMFGEFVVQSIFSPNYISIEEAFKQLYSSEKVKSVAISSTLMFSRSPITLEKYPLLWYKTTPVGHVKNHKFIVEDELFEQEVNDELQRMNKSEWIS